MLFTVVFVFFMAISEYLPRSRAHTASWGYIDTTGVATIAPRFDEAGPFRDGLAAARLGDRWGFVDPTGAWAIPLRFADAGPFSADARLAPALDPETRTYGFIDPSGAWVIPPSFDLAYGFVDGRAWVAQVVGRSSGSARARIHSFGLIDTSGAQIVAPRPERDPERIESVRAFSEGLAAVKIGDEWGFVDGSGGVVIPPRFEQVDAFSDGLAPVRLDGTWGFVGLDGTMSIPAAYGYAAPFRSGLAAVRNQRASFIRTKGERAVDVTFEDAGTFAEGLAAAQEGGRWGFVGPDGAWVIRPAYVEVRAFAEGRAPFRVSDGWIGQGRWGFVAPDGTEVIPAAYAEVDPEGFSEGVVAVRFAR
jgi:hypothetical protein